MWPCLLTRPAPAVTKLSFVWRGSQGFWGKSKPDPLSLNPDVWLYPLRSARSLETGGITWETVALGDREGQRVACVHTLADLRLVWDLRSVEQVPG